MPPIHCRRHLICIPARTWPRSKARRRWFISTATNAAHQRPCWLHYNDWRLAVLIVNEVLVAHLVFSILWMQKAFELQSFENMLQSLQIFGRFFNPSHQFDDKKAPFVGVGTLHKNWPLIEGIRQQHRCRGGRDVRVFVWLVRFVVAWLVLGYFFFFFTSKFYLVTTYLFSNTTNKLLGFLKYFLLYYYVNHTCFISYYLNWIMI